MFQLFYNHCIPLISLSLCPVQAMSGTNLSTQVSNRPGEENFITPPRSEADAIV
jgi:hypothetical protein